MGVIEVKAILDSEAIKQIAKEVNLINQAPKEVDTDKNHIVAKEKYFTVDEVAEDLRKKPSTIRRHLRQKLLIGTKTGKSWTISQTNLNKYLQTNYE